MDHKFTGMHKSIVRCEQCQSRSTTYDPFMVLSISAQQPTVAQCLDHFLAEEHLANYFCTRCKRETKDATLKIAVAKAPLILVIHLKRFQQYPFMKKIRGYIRYARTMDFGGAKYTLTGIVVHWGTLEHGHYISVVYKHDHWYYCNDRNVGQCDEQIALAQEAYLLFYT